jgi:hypothetical protein
MHRISSYTTKWKKNKSEWCAGIDMEGSHFSQLQTNHLQLARQKTMPISGQDSNHTRYVWKVMRLIPENSFNWRYVYTHLIFFKITSLSINTPLPVVLPRVVARLEVLNWDLFQSIRHSSLHIFNSPKMVSFQLDLSWGKQKEIGWGQVWAVGRLGQRCHGLFRQKLSH